MAKINLDKLTLDELRQLAKDVDAAINEARKANRQKAKDAAREAAAKFGFSLSELVTDGKKQQKTAPAAPPKYAHPENSSATWTGRGRQPKWIKDALEAGKSLEDFLIAK